MPTRAARLNLAVSAYVAILVWNQAQDPVALNAEPDSSQLARVNVPCYIRRSVAPLLRRIASVAKLSENAAAEALIARDQRSGKAALTILPARG